MNLHHPIFYPAYAPIFHSSSIVYTAEAYSFFPHAASLEENP